MTQYSNGRLLEYATMARLEADGYWTMRAPGSKGKVDVVAIKPGQILLVQCKKSKPIGPAERAELRALAAWLDAVPLEARWVKEGRAARTVGFWHVLADTQTGRPARAGWTADYAIGAEGA